MIIFYNRKTNVIYGLVEGRFHQDPEKEYIKTSDMEEVDVGKYIVPYKQTFVEIDVPIKKMFMVDQVTGEMEERQVGTEKKRVPDGLVPDVDFAETINKFEIKELNIFDYKVILNSENQVIGFQKK